MARKRDRSWCPGPELNRHELFSSRDFKSRASASFATRAFPGKQMLSRWVATVAQTWQSSPAGKSRPMQGRSQAILAIAIAYAVMLILISPAVPSLQSTTPLRQTEVPQHIVFCFAVLLIATAAAHAALSRGQALTAALQQALSGSEFVERTTVRRC